MERYWVANGILASNECGGLVKYDDAQRALDAEREKAKQLGRTLADVYQQRDGLQAQLRQVEGENELLKSGQRYMALEKERDTLRQLVEVHTKQLTELTIIPIGCSREQELRWTQSIKDLRAVLAAQDAGKAVSSG